MSQAGDEVGTRRRVAPPRHAPVALPVPKTADPKPLRPRPWRSFAAAATLALETRRLFLLLPFSVIAGILASLATPAEPDPVALAAGGAALAVAVPVLWTGIVGLRLLTLGAAFWLGFCLLAIHGALFGTAMLARPAYGTYEVRIDEILTEDESGRRAIVSHIRPVGDARALPIRRARIIVGGDLSLAPGDVVQAPIRFYAVPGPVIPNGFDTQLHAYFDGVGAYGNSTGAVALVASGQPSAPERIVDGIRRGIAQRVDAALAQPAAGIARALITGDQSEVTDEARETMAAAGLAHVLSVSGLHLTIVAGGVFVALRLGLSLVGSVARRLSVKQVAALGGIVAALFYFAISGGNVAALRSTIMILLVLGAVVFGRRALTMRNVAIAALIVLATDPASVLRPSFQLSFAAVVALIGVWEMVRPAEFRARPLLAQLGGYFAGIVVTSLVAGIATLLFSVYHFQQTSPLGVLGNLFSLPHVGFVMMPAAVFATLLMPLGLEQPFLFAMGWSIERMLELGALVASWSGGIDASPLLSPLALLFGLAAFAWFAFFEGWHRLLGPALLFPAVGLLALDRPPDVLVSDTTQAVALRGREGLALVAGRAGSFAVEVWAETYGEPIEPAALLGCDSLGCFGRSAAGFSLALVTDPAAFFEDCAEADLVIARIRAPRSCAAGMVIDAPDLAAGGIHWLRWEAGAGTFEVRTAIPAADRPWRVGR